MKKKYSLFILALAFIFFGCDNLQRTNVDENNYEITKKISLIANNAEVLINKNEFLSNLNTAVRSTQNTVSDNLSNSELSAEDIEKLTCFTNSPSSYLYENINLNETDSEKNLNLLYSIYNEATVDEVIFNMNLINSDMAKEYKESISKFYNNLESSIRSAIDIHGGIGSQKLYIFQDNVSARAITFATDLTWSSVARYVSYSVAAIAGASCYKWGMFPWIRYPGLAVCLSGIGCMGTLIARWSCSPQMLIITESIKSIANSVSRVKKLINLSDKEKRNAFLSELKNSLQNYINKNPNYAADIKKNHRIY